MDLLATYLETHAPVADAGAVEQRLKELSETCARELDGVPIDPLALARALGTLPDEVTEIADDTAIEVALATSCATGSEAALARFDARYAETIASSIAHLRLDRDDVAEVRQHVRRKLLVAEDGPPRIAEYAGRGRLHGLVKVIAVRAALDLLRAKGRDAPGDHGLGALPSPERDPELAFLQAHYRAAFARAFEAAAATLEARERNWLRLTLVSDVGLEEIARMYGVHRATVVRTLAKARQHLLDETRKGLRRDLQIGLGELESVMKLIGSRLDVSVARMLRSTS